MLIGQVQSEALISSLFARSAQIVRDLAVSSVEVIIGRMKKSLVRREYADQVYLVDAADSVYRAVFARHSPARAQPIRTLQPSVKLLGISVASLFTDLFGEIKGTIPRALERPFVIPETATVYELTSVVVNVIRRMTEFDGPVLDAIIGQQLSGNWDGSLPESVIAGLSVAEPETGHHQNTNRFISDILGALETSLDNKSKSLRRPMQTLLFQLNNYNYIKNSLQVLLGSYISESASKRYDQIIEALIRSFTNR
jgi:hypothetical protein